MGRVSTLLAWIVIVLTGRAFQVRLLYLVPMFGTWESVSYCSLNCSGLDPNCLDANEDRKARAFLVGLLYLVPVFHSWTNHTLQWVEIQIWFIEYITLQMLLQLAKRNHLGPSCNHNDLPHVDGEL